MAEFRNVDNPTLDELRRWAASESLAPMEDWDLVVADHEPWEDLFDLVEEGPAAEFFLTCLYVRAGDAVRSGNRARITQLVDRGSKRQHDWLLTWARRTETLMISPETFKYHLWCGGGFASDPAGQ